MIEIWDFMKTLGVTAKLPYKINVVKMCFIGVREAFVILVIL